MFAASVLASCGPSAEEKAAAEKMRQDSIQSVMDKMAADSIAAVQAIEQARMDSMKPVVADPKVTGQPKVGQKKPGAK